MLKAILIDDEKDALEVLLDEIEKHCPEIEVVDTCLSGEEGVKSIRKHTPDVVFLDIDMPGLNGFEVLEKVKNIDFEVVFTTAFEKYAIRAFRLSAIDYLLKPINKTELREATLRLMKHRENIRLFEERYKEFKDNLNQNNPHKKIILSTQKSHDLIALQDILYCEADGNYTTVYLVNVDKKLYSRKIKYIEEILESYNFFRVHTSFLVNLNHIKSYIKGDGGEVQLTNNKKIPVARKRKDELLKQLKNL